MIKGNYLSSEERLSLETLSKDKGLSPKIRLRLSALLLLDDGLNCQDVGRVLRFDDDTIRIWYKKYKIEGIDGICSFNYKTKSCFLTDSQFKELSAWLQETLPSSIHQIGAWIKERFDVEYSSSGLKKVVHRLGFKYQKPKSVPAQAAEEKQEKFINSYNNLLNNLEANEAVVFVDAVHPTHQTKTEKCWLPSFEKVALKKTSGRNRLNIHAGLNLETGETNVVTAETIDAQSTIKLFEKIEKSYPDKKNIRNS
jgi:transposase